MSPVELTEAFLAKIAGWEAMKTARSLLAADQVLSSNWTPPVLKGIVQEGPTAYRAGLVIKDAIDLENLCSCRASRQWGTICAHSVAVGLHALRDQNPAASAAPGASKKKPTSESPASPGAPQRMTPRLRRAGDGESGEPAEIFVILPPNLPQAVAKGKVMVYFEAKWRKGRLPLNALSLTTPFRFSTPDAVLLDWIESQTGGAPPALIQLTTQQLGALLNCLLGHPRVSLGKSCPLAIAPESGRPRIQAVLEPAGEIVLKATLDPPPGCWIPADLHPAETPATDPPLPPAWLFNNQVIQPVYVPPSCADLGRGPVRLTRPKIPQFLMQDWPKLQSDCDVTANFRLEDFTLEPQTPRFSLSLAGGIGQLQAQLQCAYGPRIMTLGITAADDSFWLPDPGKPTRYSTRDLAAEQAALNRLQRAGFFGPDVNGRYRLTGETLVLNFLARDFPRLQKEWAVTLEERLERHTLQNLERIEPRFQVTPSGEPWFDLDITYATRDGQQLSPADIQRLILSGQSHTRLRDGRRVLIDTGALEDFQEVLRDCNPEQREGHYRLSSNQAGFLEATLRQQTGWQIQAPASWRERAAQQRGEIHIEPPPLGSLEAVLRPYQKQGVAWLGFLRKNHFGGILADEMGLGKTLQTLAFLRSLKPEPPTLERGCPCPQPAPDAKGGTHNSNASALAPPPVARPALVVCPTSLVYNWVAEARRFTPELRVLALHGPDRHSLFRQIPEHDLIVTSYALVRRDAERYRGLEFDTLVLDEAQHIKNRQSQNALAVKSIRAPHRFVLTGTPLENSVLDLWSICDFLMPGYLGSPSDFRDRYEIPISRERDAAVQMRLARRIRPFMLRRLKREVAPDLPEKIEQISYCDLTEQQATVYREILEASRRELFQTVNAQGLAKSRMVIFNALLRLRQVCCDLRLLKLENLDPDQVSGKLELFGELLDEVLDGGHRVLVFSQFTSQLALLREKLTADGIEFCYLDGGTTNRGEVVDRFQKSANIPVFLISLKAGGLGLNLAAADTVIHFDPWWNPAVEDQATDRAHRLGQTRVVTSYKLITRGTIEEKIVNLQTKKREISRSLLDGEEAFAGALTWEEIQDLLS